MPPKGFSLLEFLVIFGILGLLGALTFFFLEPAELLAEWRDSQRITYLHNLKSAIKDIDSGCGIELPDNEFYSFVCDPKTKAFELNARMESRRYSRGGKSDVVSTDGGDQPDVYEISNH